jgi:hypothetical protein
MVYGVRIVHRNGFKPNHRRRLRPITVNYPEAIMADPLSTTASIIAVLQLGATVVTYLYFLHGATEERQKLTHEIEAVTTILSALNNHRRFNRRQNPVESAMR